MSDYKQQITELAELMDEFRLGEAQMQTEGVRMAFKRRATVRTVAASEGSVELVDSGSYEPEMPEAPVVQAQAGTPITSPMNGIFYASPSPGSAAFVKEGESIQAGQVVGLIEAMKVFNEIPATVSGTVLKLVAESGAIVQPGDVLLYVG